ncbi:MAG: guanylate kinase [Bacteroidota bacterium]
MSSKGKAIIFSAPSGSGKTTIVKHIVKTNSVIDFSISACTRDKRGRSEVNGKDYYFMSPSEFKNKIDEKEFIEWQEVYEGNFYGTLKSEIERIWEKGHHVIFDVDVKGGLNLKKYFGDRALAIFVKVPSFETLKERLKDRGSEDEKSLSQRLFKAEFEMGFEDQFDISLSNEKLDDTLEKAEKLVNNFVDKD